MKRPACYLLLCASLVLPTLSSCGIPAAAGRSMGRVMAMSSTPEHAASHAAFTNALRELPSAQGKQALTPAAADSTR